MTITVDEITALANALIDADAAVDHAEEALKSAKELARTLREETIPGAMQELGVESLTLTTGHKLSLAKEVYASIPVANKSAAFRWLEDNGFGGLIKTEVDAMFSKGELETAKALVNELRERGFSADIGQSVHAQTLKAFIKEQLAKGASVPLDLFGARPVLTAKISSK